MRLGKPLDQPRVMTNQLKRLDVFRCVHEAHSGFEARVSVHHVLTEKECYPQGCVYFRWHCLKMDRGGACPRKFNHVGRLCHGCTHFVDEKAGNHLRLLLDDLEYNRFQKNLQAYQQWLDHVRGSEVSFYGEVHSVKPKAVRIIYPSGGSETRLEGYLVSFADGYLDYTHFQDPLYMVLGFRSQQRLGLETGDRLNCLARVSVDRGRIVLRRPKAFDLDHKVPYHGMSASEARVALRTAAHYPMQPEKCFVCRHGILVDGVDRSGHRERKFRSMSCLKGVRHPLDCVVPTLEGIENETCLEELEASTLIESRSVRRR